MNKQEVIEEIRIRAKYDSEYRTSLIRSDQAIELIKKIDESESRQLDEPQKVTVPEEFDEWFLQIKQKWGKAAEQFALWKICQFGFGHYFEDVSHERTPLDLSAWVSNHKDEAVHAILKGYEVEEEPKWIVKVGKLYFCGWEDTTAQFVLNAMLGEDESIIKYKNKGTASSVAKILGGTVEKVEV